MIDDFGVPRPVSKESMASEQMLVMQKIRLFSLEIDGNQGKCV